MNPELGRLLCGLYQVPMPRAPGSSCDTSYTPKNPATGRADLFDIFLTGIKLGQPFAITTASGAKVTLPVGTAVNRPTKGTNGNGAGIVASDMLRLNTALKPGAECSNPPNYSLGLLAGDACGFPNGRRLADDATRIELLAVAGAAWQPVTGDTSFNFNSGLIPVLTDGVTHNDVPFLATFPYVASPHQGQVWYHENLYRGYFTIVARATGTADMAGHPR
jgi:hypothetical protein